MKKNDFIKFMIECDVLRFGDFTLKSGRKSPHFINTGKYTTNKQIEKLCKHYADLIVSSGQKFDVLYGPAYKGISLANVTGVFLPFECGISYNRKEVKDHGEGGSLLGYIPTDKDRVAIIEDVTTAGTSIRETRELFQKLSINAEITALYISVDRMEYGVDKTKSAIREIQEKFGIEVYSIVNMKDIIQYLKDDDNEFAEKIENYLKLYGPQS
jgi:orotate phosphoribosyltransferase